MVCIFKSRLIATQFQPFLRKSSFSGITTATHHSCCIPPVKMPPKPELTSDQRKQVVSQLLLLLKDGNQPPELKRGALTAVANNFDVRPRTVGKIWKRARLNFEDPTIGAFCASPCKKNKCGAKQKWNRDDVREALLLVPIQLVRSRQSQSMSQHRNIESS
jgi:hypothetical protein